jgi:hypothetical protein
MSGELWGHTASAAFVTVTECILVHWTGNGQARPCWKCTSIYPISSEQSIALKEDASEIRFQLESDNPAPHIARIHFSAPAGQYTVRDERGTVADAQLGNGQEITFDLLMNASTAPKTFTLAKEGGASPGR